MCKGWVKEWVPWNFAEDDDDDNDEDEVAAAKPSAKSKSTGVSAKVC